MKKLPETSFIDNNRVQRGKNFNLSQIFTRDGDIAFTIFTIAELVCVCTLSIGKRVADSDAGGFSYMEKIPPVLFIKF